MMIFSLMACAANGFRGSVNEGIYISVNRAFAVQIPVFAGVEVHDGVKPGLEWVDFQTGCCDWQGAGGYSLEWLRIAKPPHNFGAFIEQADRLILENIKTSIDPDIKFKAIEQRSFAINGKQSRQVIGHALKQGVAVVYAATAVNFSDRLALGIVIFSMEASYREHYQAAAAWKRYVIMMRSLRRLS